jgi:hypothetical protein
MDYYHVRVYLIHGVLQHNATNGCLQIFAFQSTINVALLLGSRSGCMDYITGWTTHDTRLDSRQGRFFSSSASRKTMVHPASYSIPAGRREAVGAWTWPLTTIQFWGYEWVAPYLYPHICLHGVDRDNSTFIINKSTWHRALNCKLTTTLFLFFKTYKRFEGWHKPADKYYLSIVRLVQAPLLLNLQDVSKHSLLSTMMHTIIKSQEY